MERLPLDQPDHRNLIAYRLPQPRLRLTPAPAVRAWMDKTMGGFASDRFAYRCLPLLMANQNGWVLLNSHRFFVVWNGGKAPSDLRIVYRKGEPPYPASSHFGDGILTFIIPYLFRTPPDWNLLVRGPANMPKDGASALEGTVEADWTNATFSMNWKITRTNFPVAFGIDEPICMIVPQRRSELETFKPEIRDIDSDPEVKAGFGDFHAARVAFQARLQVADPAALQEGWQRNYFRGMAINGQRARDHQTKLRLKPFVDMSQQEAGAQQPPPPGLACPYAPGTD